MQILAAPPRATENFRQRHDEPFPVSRVPCPIRFAYPSGLARQRGLLDRAFQLYLQITLLLASADGWLPLVRFVALVASGRNLAAKSID